MHSRLYIPAPVCEPLLLELVEAQIVCPPSDSVNRVDLMLCMRVVRQVWPIWDAGDGWERREVCGWGTSVTLPHLGGFLWRKTTMSVEVHQSLYLTGVACVISQTGERF